MLTSLRTGLRKFSCKRISAWSWCKSANASLVRPVMPEQPAHGDVVALLHVGLVILTVAAAAGEGDPLSSAVREEGVIDELGAIVRVEGLHLERQPSAGKVESGSYALMAQAPDGL